MSFGEVILGLGRLTSSMGGCAGVGSLLGLLVVLISSISGKSELRRLGWVAFGSAALGASGTLLEGAVVISVVRRSVALTCAGGRRGAAGGEIGSGDCGAGFTIVATGGVFVAGCGGRALISAAGVLSGFSVLSTAVDTALGGLSARIFLDEMGRGRSTRGGVSVSSESDFLVAEAFSDRTPVFAGWGRAIFFLAGGIGTPGISAAGSLTEGLGSD